jgi:hypothetical protein
VTLYRMVALIKLIFGLLADLFRSRAALEAENLVLRQQIIVLRRGKPARLPFMATEKLVLGWICRLFPNARDALAIVQPETVSALASRGLSILLALEVEWAAGTSGCARRDPPVDPGDEYCQSDLGSASDPRRTAQAWDRYWADQRRQVHGAEARTSVARMEDISAQSCGRYRRHGLFVVPTVSFRLLYGLLIMGHGRRQILWLGVTANPTAEWIANQLTEACGWERPPSYLIRDRDACYGNVSSAAFSLSAFATTQHLCDHPGRMAMRSV